jgi:hypothetical protein
MKAWDNINNGLLQRITKIGTQGAMKNHGKALHEFPTPITQNWRKEHI